MICLNHTSFLRLKDFGNPNARRTEDTIDVAAFVLQQCRESRFVTEKSQRDFSKTLILHNSACFTCTRKMEISRTAERISGDLQICKSALTDRHYGVEANLPTEKKSPSDVALPYVRQDVCYQPR